MKFNNKKIYKYGLSEKDLIGKLEGFPLEVVEKMIENQVKQGNKPDVTIFQNDHWANRYSGGFDWSIVDVDTSINYFWSLVIVSRNFNLFFEKYPK